MIRLYDPTGAHNGIPTYPWRVAPEHLATRAQLTAMGLRPIADPVAQLAWRGKAAHRPCGEPLRTAALFHLADTLRRDPPSDARLTQLAAARATRRICPACTRDAGYVIPARYGVCLDCHDLEIAA